MADTGFVYDKPLTFDYGLDPGRGNLNFVPDTSSYFALSFYKVWLNSLYCFFELWLTHDLYMTNL